MPSPPHALHLFFIVEPRPPHAGHGVSVCMRPKRLLMDLYTTPVPWHCWQVSVFLSSLPVPLQWAQVTYLRTLNFLVTPVATSAKLSFTFRRRSEPWCCCVPLEPPNPLNPPKPPPNAPWPPKMSPNMEKMSSMFMLAPPPNPPAPFIPACPNWSYLCLFSGSRRTSYASAASLNFSSASLLPGFLSG